MKPGPVVREFELRKWLKKLPGLELHVGAIVKLDGTKRLFVYPLRDFSKNRAYEYPLDIPRIIEEWKLEAVIARLTK